MSCSSRFMLGATFIPSFHRRHAVLSNKGQSKCLCRRYWSYSYVKLDNITEVINSELEMLKEWLQGNKLSLNIDKTTSMIIGTKRKLTDENGENLLPNFTLDGKTIQHKNAAKYLAILSYINVIY